MSKKKTNKADLLIYKALNKALQEEKIKLYIDFSKINRPGSPIYDPWETLLPILVPSIIGIILILTDNILCGLLFMVGMIIIYINYFKKKIYKEILDKAKHSITQDYESCEKLWNFGGIVFVNSENKKIGCISPEGNWKEFVIKNYADYMVEKPHTEKETQENDKPTEEEKLSA